MQSCAFHKGSQVRFEDSNFQVSSIFTVNTWSNIQSFRQSSPLQILSKVSDELTGVTCVKSKNSPAARHTGSSNLKTNPHTTSEAMAPDSPGAIRVKVGKDGRSMAPLASQTPALCSLPAAVKRVRSSAQPHELSLPTPGLLGLFHSGQQSPRRTCYWGGNSSLSLDLLRFFLKTR